MSQEDPVADELRKLVRLFAIQRVSGLKKGEAASLLSLAGFSNRDIAALLATSESSVRGFLSVARKRATED